MKSRDRWFWVVILDRKSFLDSWGNNLGIFMNNLWKILKFHRNRNFLR